MVSTGIATVFYYIFGARIGTVTLIMNIPLFFIAFMKLGKKFFIRAIIGTVVLSLLLDLFESIFSDVRIIADDKLLASIYGGLIVGIGNGIILKNNASTGGTELLSNIISRYFPSFKVGNLLVIFDTIIVIINMVFLKQIEIGLYSAIAIYIIGKSIEIVAEGTNFTKMIFIVSDRYEEIADEISKKLERGSTAIYARGMYQRKEKMVLWCVASKHEIVKIRQIASKIDGNSFMTIFNAREAYGLGFKEE
ncbi:MAG: YitT family protein [Clostridia bacterium]|nr:YitT family protein [Clostridia bacterium]